ncbi:hypothetical protein Bbelb_214170 [Branchiostoma belcheri]|nr:hypothetical protein Bbelb_214170 [Branchiostoma belcheri]
MHMYTFVGWTQFHSAPYWEQSALQTTDSSVNKSATCQVGNGASYRGTVNVTKKGVPCQRWESQTPHEHSRTPENYPSSGLEQNYCRNPDHEPGVWCYVMENTPRWDFCDVPGCGCEAIMPSDGSDYRGNLSVTRSGKTCQRWDTQSPHAHNFWPNVYPELVENYCRMPAKRWFTIWCYTTDNNTHWEYCNDPRCTGGIVP